MKLTIGWPSIRPNAPSWKTSTVAPRVASTESRKPEGRGQRDQDRAEHEHQQHERQPDHDGEVDRQRVGEPVGDVGLDGGQPGDSDRRRRCSSSMSAWPSRRSVSRSSVAGVVRAGRRGDQDLRAGAGLVHCRRPGRSRRPSAPAAQAHDVAEGAWRSAVGRRRDRRRRAAAEPRGPGRTPRLIRSEALRCVVSADAVLSLGSARCRSLQREGEGAEADDDQQDDGDRCACRRQRAQRTPLLRIRPSCVALRRACVRTLPPKALDFSSAEERRAAG